MNKGIPLDLFRPHQIRVDHSVVLQDYRDLCRTPRNVAWGREGKSLGTGIGLDGREGEHQHLDVSVEEMRACCQWGWPGLGGYQVQEAMPSRRLLVCAVDKPGSPP